MIKLEGTVINTFRVDGGTNKKGEEYEARDKVQLLGSLELPNGQVKNELIDLTVEDSRIYEAFKKYYREENLSIESLVSDIRAYSQYFCKMALGQEEDKELSYAFKDLKELKKF